MLEHLCLIYYFFFAISFRCFYDLLAAYTNTMYTIMSCNEIYSYIIYYTYQTNNNIFGVSNSPVHSSCIKPTTDSLDVWEGKDERGRDTFGIHILNIS